MLERRRSKVLVITGASAGVGRAAARLFARDGADVALPARDREALDNARAEVESYGRRALAIPIAVSDADALERAAFAVESQLGPIDVWVNNAMVTVFSPVALLQPDEVRRVTEAADGAAPRPLPRKVRLSGPARPGADRAEPARQSVAAGTGRSWRAWQIRATRE
ncbi:MAG: SDR family NAD(P)-dependent oxidoreductase [Steroidobacteraceae bacterium]